MVDLILKIVLLFNLHTLVVLPQPLEEFRTSAKWSHVTSNSIQVVNSNATSITASVSTSHATSTSASTAPSTSTRWSTSIFTNSFIGTSTSTAPSSFTRISTSDVTRTSTSNNTTGIYTSLGNVQLVWRSIMSPGVHLHNIVSSKFMIVVHGRLL